MYTDEQDFKGLIHEAALDAGFAACRITTADPVDIGPLLNWLERGMQGEMAYMARDPRRRCDPHSVLEGARSVVCCALAYGDEGIADGADCRAHGRAGPCARFARGSDYHRVVREKLSAVVAAIKVRAPDARTRCCVDTSPLMEKALAARAGLGWIGKNTLLIHPQLGSWFVIGEIVTDVEIPPDAALTNNCGSCSRCMDRCPTGALSAGELDARRCVSYLTIERRGPVDEHLARHIANGAYGCDACQEACPYNNPRRH